MDVNSNSLISEDLSTLDLNPKNEMQEVILNALINEGRRREREDIIKLLMNMYNLSCCCDEATFGDHYLSDKQPDGLIKLIRDRQL